LLAPGARHLAPVRESLVAVGAGGNRALRSVTTGWIAATPSSTAWRTIASIVSAATMACASVVAARTRGRRIECVDARPRVALAGARDRRAIFAARSVEERDLVARARRSTRSA
jgi:hypothetical protein